MFEIFHWHNRCVCFFHLAAFAPGFKKSGLFSGGTNSLEQRGQKLGAPRNLGPFFLGENSLEQRSQKLGASRNLDLFVLGKNSLEQRTHKLGASRNLGCLSSGEKQP